MYETTEKTQTSIKSEMKTKVPLKDDNAIPQDWLRIYYENYFPHELFFYWLGLGDIEIFQRREFSFTLQNDAYLRFQSFSSWQQFKNKLINLSPKKIDIGAIYNVLPSLHNSDESFKPVQKEIVFDIDMDAYDDIRTCCQDTNICEKCWKYMIVAYLIIDATLKEDFGYEHLIYEFSGRRGIHCWVSDNRARQYKDNIRKSVVEYIQYKTVNVEMNISPGLKYPIHPMFVRAIEIIDKYFHIVLREQNLLSAEKGQMLLKGLIKGHFYGIKIDFNEIDNILNSKEKPSDVKFNEIEELLKRAENARDKGKNNNLSKTYLCINDFKLNVMYPKLDMNVSTHINHLLKSPFSIHPKTGLVSVPLSHDDILNFKLENIPNIYNLVNDYRNHKENETFNKFKNIFEIFVKKLNQKK